MSVSCQDKRSRVTSVTDKFGIAKLLLYEKTHKELVCRKRGRGLEEENELAV